MQSMEISSHQTVDFDSVTTPGWNHCQIFSFWYNTLGIISEASQLKKFHISLCWNYVLPVHCSSESGNNKRVLIWEQFDLTASHPSHWQKLLLCSYSVWPQFLSWFKIIGRFGNWCCHQYNVKILNNFMTENMLERIREFWKNF